MTIEINPRRKERPSPDRPRVFTAKENPDETQFIYLPDGRKLAYKSFGNVTDPVVLLFTGSPGCRLGPVPVEEDLKQRGVRLITFDRPGYGASDPKPFYTA